ncbi:PPOX class F420-dependent oxidoreductase [Streptomyces sp. NBC_01803]|uniref:PPOX class F420-dependent oxidoreductase n=1 Tax=Streptomyces sp. NBC_01803 TaxID=2975946 RepID=UPI002DDC3D9E|nr:PPOX class F420-dependent oxidoreductase [Streptomyces sp. NBC_01803]WSA44833.1 PPOX class F420-dependent oxidoreductase [Streptomyces sp. NBC_01803]
MSLTLPDGVKTLLDSAPHLILATIQPDGSPQLSPVWGMRDGEEVLISTTVGRRKELNLRRDPRATVLVRPSTYVYAEIRGTVTVSPDPEWRLVDELSRRYTGRPYAEFNPRSVHDAPRVVVRVSPRKIHTQGLG